MLFAITAMLLIASFETKAQSAIGSGPGMVPSSRTCRVVGKYGFITLLRISEFGCTVLSYFGAGYIVAQHFPDEAYMDEFGRLHMPENAQVFDDETGEDITEGFMLYLEGEPLVYES